MGHFSEPHAAQSVLARCEPSNFVVNLSPGQRDESGLCQTVHGGALDQPIGEIVVGMTPLAIEIALRVQQELTSRHKDLDQGSVRTDVRRTP
jgi:hypothetical protein